MSRLGGVGSAFALRLRALVGTSRFLFAARVGVDGALVGSCRPPAFANLAASSAAANALPLLPPGVEGPKGGKIEFLDSPGKILIFPPLAGFWVDPTALCPIRCWNQGLAEFYSPSQNAHDHMVCGIRVCLMVRPCRRAHFLGGGMWGGNSPIPGIAGN